MKNKFKSIYQKGFTLPELIISMSLAMVIFLLLGYVSLQVNRYHSEQFVREHVVNYGNMAMTEFNKLFKSANNISISNLSGMSRISFQYPNKKTDVLRVSRDNGFFINNRPLLRRENIGNGADINYFMNDKNNIIEYRISEFDCSQVPASLGLFGKLTETLYRVHMTIEVVRKVNGMEITRDFQFNKDIFAVREYIS
ncbi:MAG: PilW family protein [Fidelibacterota bacterium]